MNRLLLPLILFTASLAHAETYYFAPDGKDSAKGTTADKPMRTFFKLNEIAKPGDTFIVAAGTYDLGKTFPSFNCAGTADAPIRIRAAEGARPRLRFEGWNAITIGPGSAYVEVSGFDIEGAAGSITLEEAKTAEKPKSNARLNGNGVTIDGRKADEEKKPRPHHIRLRDLRVWGCPGGGISAIQCDYITVEDCTVSGCAWYSTFACSGISVWQAWAFDKEPGHHIRIVRNRCFDNRQYLPGRAGGSITDGNGIIVDDSRNTQQGSKLGAYAGRILVQGNVCSQNGGSGIHTYETDHVDILDNVLWLNNQTPEFNNGQIFVNDSSDIHIAGNTLTAPEGKPATGNFHRNDRPANEGIVWADNILLRSKPGKDTEGGDAIVQLPRPVEKQEK